MSVNKDLIKKVVLTQAQFTAKQTAGTLQEGVEYEISDYQEPVQDVQINSTSILSNGVANIPIAVDTQGSSSLGVIKTERAYGLAINNQGLMYVNSAQANEVTAKTGNMKPLTPVMIDTAIKAGLGSYNGTAFTDAEKTTARNTIGACAMQEYDSTASSYADNVLYYTTE